MGKNKIILICILLFSFVFFSACKSTNDKIDLSGMSKKAKTSIVTQEPKPSLIAVQTPKPSINASQVPKDNELKWTWCIKADQYSDLFFLDKDLIAAKQKNNKYVILDTKGAVAISGEYSEVSCFKEGLLAVASNGKTFFINKKGDNVFHKDFDNTLDFSEGLAAINIDGYWGYIDKLGKVVIQNQFSDVKNFHENSAAVQKNHKWGLIDQFGKVVLDYYYDEINEFQSGYYAVMKNGKWGFIDNHGKVVAKCIYNEVKNFSEGYAAVMKNGKWGFINNSGKRCIDLKYNDVGNFNEGKVSVKRLKNSDDLGEWAYVDYKDNIVIDFYPYDASASDASIYVGEFKEGLAFVSKTEYSIIDAKGKNAYYGGDTKFFIGYQSYNKEYDAIPAYVYIDDSMKIRKYGLMGLKGNQRLEPVFDNVDGIYGAYVIVENMVDDEYKMGLIKMEKE